MGFINLDSGKSDEMPTFVKEYLFIDYRAHEFSDGSYKIYKDINEEPSYIINPTSGCDCPAATYRNKICKHEKMVGFNRVALDTFSENSDTLYSVSPELSTSDLNQLKNDLM